MKSRLFKAIILGLAIGVLGVLLSPFRFALNLEENSGLGLLFKLRGVQQPSGEVIVVSIEKESSDYLNLPNNPDKWPRSLHARLVDNLVREGAAVILFDVHFIEEEGDAHKFISNSWYLFGDKTNLTSRYSTIQLAANGF